VGGLGVVEADSLVAEALRPCGPAAVWPCGCAPLRLCGSAPALPACLPTWPTGKGREGKGGAETSTRYGDEQPWKRGRGREGMLVCLSVKLALEEERRSVVEGVRPLVGPRV
jgi:hypothetical protein